MQWQSRRTGTGNHPSGIYEHVCCIWTKDFEIEGDKLVSKVNSPEAVKNTEFFVDMIKRGGSSSWSKIYLYDCGVDLGTGNTAMVLDADNNPVHQNWEGASEDRNIAFARCLLRRKGILRFPTTGHGPLR